MDPSKSSDALSLKDLLFVKSTKNNIAERVKMFLPQIAKANAELEEADEATRQSMIMEKVEELKSDDSSSDESDSSEDDNDEEEEVGKESAKGDHVEIVFQKFEEHETDEEESSTDEEKELKEDEQDDFIIRRSDNVGPESK